MTQNLNHALEYSNQWIDIIHKDRLVKSEAKWVIDESKYNFAEHFNRNWLDYRKSVTEGGGLGGS